MPVAIHQNKSIKVELVRISQTCYTQPSNYIRAKTSPLMGKAFQESIYVENDIYIVARDMKFVIHDRIIMKMRRYVNEERFLFGKKSTAQVVGSCVRYKVKCYST